MHECDFDAGLKLWIFVELRLCCSFPHLMIASQPSTQGELLCSSTGHILITQDQMVWAWAPFLQGSQDFGIECSHLAVKRSGPFRLGREVLCSFKCLELLDFR